MKLINIYRKHIKKKCRKLIYSIHRILYRDFKIQINEFINSSHKHLMYKILINKELIGYFSNFKIVEFILFL
jgi:hypothetical protein